MTMLRPMRTHVVNNAGNNNNRPPPRVDDQVR